MNSFQKQYKEKIVPALKEKLDIKNTLAVPTIEKVVINVGVGSGLKDKEFIKAVKKTLERISGQKPVEALARKSISNFKIRDGMVVGIKVCLRGDRMWDFIEKLVKVTLPRVRDFRGISTKGFDQEGNYSLGLKEYISFPEIDQDEVERLHGLQVNITTTSETKESGLALLTELGFPFKTEKTK
jgi:large subunit ribosomal protein L5